MKLRVATLATLGLWIAASSSYAAENLKLAPGLSFTDDSSDAFPIQGDDLMGTEAKKDRPTVVFFGASNCWNTNREAERLVSLYPAFRDRVSFIVVDVSHPSAEQRALFDAHYRGFIPTVAILGRDGSVVYSESGETSHDRGDSRELATLIEKALGR